MSDPAGEHGSPGRPGGPADRVRPALRQKGKRRGEQSPWPVAAEPWPDPDRWTSQDLHAQHERFETLAYQPLTVEVPGGEPIHFPAELRPYLGRGEDHKRLMQLRCGARSCGVLVGAVWCVSASHRGSPFTWAEVKIIDDRRAEPVTFQVFKMVLDDISRHLSIRSDCPAHGRVEAPVAALLDRLPDAARRLMERGRSAKFVLQPPSRI